MSDLTDQLLALAKHTGAPDVVEDAAHMLKSLEGVRAERDVLQEIVDEQRGQIATLVSRVAELTAERDETQDERRHAVAALSEQVDTLQRMVCRALYTDELMQRNHAKVCGWRCFEATP